MLVDQWQIDKDANQPAPHHWGNTPLRWAAEELSCDVEEINRITGDSDSDSYWAVMKYSYGHLSVLSTDKSPHL